MAWYQRPSQLVKPERGLLGFRSIAIATRNASDSARETKKGASTARQSILAGGEGAGAGVGRRRSVSVTQSRTRSRRVRTTLRGLKNVDLPLTRG